MQRRKFIAMLGLAGLASALSSSASAASALVIDVREPREFAAGHIEGAINIPYEEIGPRIGQVLKDRNAPAILYSHSGRRSGVALQVLKDLGYTHAQNYGGIEEARKRLAGTCSAGAKC